MDANGREGAFKHVRLERCLELKDVTDFVSRQGAEAQRTDEKMEKGLQGVGVVVWFG